MFNRIHKILPRALAAVLACTALLTVTAFAKSDHWYCVHAKDHQRPRVDGSLSYIEKYDGYYIGSDEDDKVIYLTFDAGYENGNVGRILDVMKQEQVSGAFFILGNLIERNPDLVQRMEEEGHLVCNHTDRHRNMTTFATKEEFSEELKRLEQRYFDLTGKSMAPYYRPPEGTFDERTLKYASELGYKTVFWSFAYADWDNEKQPDPKEAKEKILSNIHNGAVLLLHPTSETNAKILGDVILELKQAGYRFGTLDELTAPVPQPR